MSSSSVSLIIAIVGVAGTLSAALLTQYATMHTKALELKDEHEKRKDEERQLNLKERREAYIALNAAARSYRRAIKNRVYEYADQTETDLQQARQEFDNRYAEAQLIAHSTVLKVAHSVSTELSDAFGQVKQLDRYRKGSLGSVQEHGEQDGLISMLNGPVSSEIRLLRRVMRDDLGVTDST